MDGELRLSESEVRAAKNDVRNRPLERQEPAGEIVDAFITASRRRRRRTQGAAPHHQGPAPEAVEIISYRMPMYKLNGKPLVGFAGFKNHVGFYPISSSFLNDYKKELKGYVTTKGRSSSRSLNPCPWRSSRG